VRPDTLTTAIVLGRVTDPIVVHTSAALWVVPQCDARCSAYWYPPADSGDWWGTGMREALSQR